MVFSTLPDSKTKSGQNPNESQPQTTKFVVELSAADRSCLERISQVLEQLVQNVQAKVADQIPFDCSDAQSAADSAALLREFYQMAESRFERLNRRMAGIEMNLSSTGEREFYTVKQTSELTGLQPYTLRQACNVGRIEAEKANDGSWRIHHSVLVEIQNNGLPSPSRG